MTTFHARLLQELQSFLGQIQAGVSQLATANQTLSAIDANTQVNGSGSPIAAQVFTEYYSSSQTVNIPPTIQLSLFVFRGNGTLIQSAGNVPLPRNLTITYPFIAKNYIYPAIQFTLNTNNTEIFLQYQLPPP